MAFRRLITGLLLLPLIAEAHAEAAKGVTAPAGVKAVLDDARRTCRKARGLKLNLGAEAIRTIDLNGDGRPDHLVDFYHVECERRSDIFCGTGGCPLAIVVALPNGKYRKLFSQHVIRHEIGDGPGARTIRFDLHGTYCDGAGADPCSKRVRIGDKPFRFRQPL